MGHKDGVRPTDRTGCKVADAVEAAKRVITRATLG